MEFHEKLQHLRKQSGLTQEELASALYVSRTAVSKWESGRGYPNLDSLKALARFFSVTVDELLSVAEAPQPAGQQAGHKLQNLVFGLSDCAMLLLAVIPLFGQRSGGLIRAVSLVRFVGVHPVLKAVYWLALVIPFVLGLLALLLRNSNNPTCLRCKAGHSLGFGLAAVLLFVSGRQPYAALLALGLLIVKVGFLLKAR